MLWIDWVSYSPPSKTRTGIAATACRAASSTSMASCSCESSFRMLGPPLARSTTPLASVGGMVVRRIPRVHMSALPWGSSGRMFTSTRSRPAVGPWKYPWSIASMSVRPEAGLKMRARRFCTPQSSEFAPFRKKASCLTGTSRWKFLVSFTSSTSGTVGLLCCGGRSWPSGRRTIAGKVRARQLEQPRGGPRLSGASPAASIFRHIEARERRHGHRPLDLSRHRRPDAREHRGVELQRERVLQLLRSLSAPRGIPQDRQPPERRLCRDDALPLPARWDGRVHVRPAEDQRQRALRSRRHALRGARTHARARDRLRGEYLRAGAPARSARSARGVHAESARAGARRALVLRVVAGARRRAAPGARRALGEHPSGATRPGVRARSPRAARPRGRPRHGRRAELVDRRHGAARSLLGAALLAGAELLPLAHHELRSRCRYRGSTDGAARRQAAAGRLHLGDGEAEPPARTRRGGESSCRGGAAALGAERAAASRGRL